MTALANPPAAAARGPVEPQTFDRNVFSRRSFFSVVMSILAGILTLLACAPLFSVLFMLAWKGGARLGKGGIAVFTRLPPGGLDTGGGFGNAIEGTLIMVGLAALISVPVGILAAIFLAELGPRTTVAVIVRFAAKVMTGLPSILAGVFAYAVIVMHLGFSAIAGGIALSLLMIPIVMLTAEGALKMVPNKMREAAIGMGSTPAQVTWKIVVPTAMPGILTGVMLAVARAAGETAPLIFTALSFENAWPVDRHRPFVHLQRATESMAVFIFNSSRAYENNIIELGWAASLVLVLMVLVFNIGGQLLSRGNRPSR